MRFLSYIIFAACFAAGMLFSLFFRPFWTFFIAGILITVIVLLLRQDRCGRRKR